MYAMKVIPRESNNYFVEAECKVLKEVERGMKSANQYGGQFISKLHYSFKTESHYHLILDLSIGGDLFQLMQKTGQMTESFAKFYI